MLGDAGRHVVGGALYTMGMTPRDYNPLGEARTWHFAEGVPGTVDVGGMNGPSAWMSAPTMSKANWKSLAMNALPGVGSTVLSAGMGFASGGVLGAASFLAQDVAVSAASVHHIPTVTNVQGLKTMVNYSSTVNAMVGDHWAAAPLRMGAHMMEGMAPMVRPIMGSMAGTIGGTLIAGPVGGFVGGMVGSHTGIPGLLPTNAAARKAGWNTAASGLKAAGKLAARHPIAGMVAVGAAVTAGAGYAAYRVAGPAARLGLGAAHGIMRYQDGQKRIDTAGDLAAWNTRRSMTAGQMAYRNRQKLGMSMRQAYNATATKYHHAQRLF